ncbi:MAG TPA: hypothetical protein DEP84_35745 [Chloroflexi bacterium]|nr:hypothetical protein [Chloroflexota bacterium]
MDDSFRLSLRGSLWTVTLGVLAGLILGVAGHGGEPALASGERLAQARALLAINDRNFFLGLAWHWGLLLLLLNSRIAARFQCRIAARIGPRWLADALFFAALLLIVDLAGWPFAYVAGYQVSHRFGLNVQTPPAWLQDQVLAAGIDIALGVPTLLVVYWLIRRWPRRWWVAAGALGLVTAVLTTLLWPVVIDPLFNRYTPVTDPAILARVERLSRVTGVPIGAVLRVDMGRRTTAANAWVTGLWGTRRIVIGDTLLDRYSPDEVEAVLAHELGHVVHHDVWWSTLAVALAQVAGLFVIARVAGRLLARFGHHWGISRLSEPASAPLALLLISVLLVIGMPVVNAGSRWREAAADRYALQVTSNPAALTEFFRAIAAQNLSDPAPPRWHVWLFMSHPPLAERIAMVERFTGRQPQGRGQQLRNRSHRLTLAAFCRKKHPAERFFYPHSRLTRARLDTAPRSALPEPVLSTRPQRAPDSGTCSSTSKLISISGESDARTEQYLLSARSTARSS